MVYLLWGIRLTEEKELEKATSTQAKTRTRYKKEEKKKTLQSALRACLLPLGTGHMLLMEGGRHTCTVGATLGPLTPPYSASLMRRALGSSRECDHSWGHY